MSKKSDEVSKKIKELMEEKRNYVFNRSYYFEQIAELDKRITHIEDQITLYSQQLIYL